LGDDDDVPRRRLEWPFLAGLLALAALVIGAYVLQDRGAANRTAEARVINTAQRQSTLTQQVALLTSRLATDESATGRRRTRSELRSAVQALMSDYEILTRNPEALGADPAPAPVRNLRAGLRIDQRMTRFTDAATRVADRWSPRLSDRPVRQVLAAARGPLARDLDRIARLYETESVRAAERLNWTLFVGSGLIVCGFIILAALVFWPLAGRMREELRTSALLEEIAVAANSASSIDDAYARCLDLVCRDVGWPLGHVWQPESDGSVRAANIWHIADRTPFGTVAEASRRMALPQGFGLPGRAVVSGAPAWIDDLRAENGYPLADVAGRAGLVGALAFPVHVDGDVAGIIEVFSTARIPRSRRLLRTINQVDVQLGRVIERERHQQDLAYRALHDDLTGLPNRTLLLEHVAGAQARTRRSGGILALLFLDIDNFKLTNDALGHQTGDTVLAAVGERLATGMRAMDVVSRFGGDEFVILCEGLKDEDEADALARRVQFLLQQQVSVDERWMSVSASIGIAIGRGGEAPEDLLRDADTAMYAAKRRARGSAARFDASMREEVSERMRLADELVGAAQRGEMRLYLQPIIDLEANRLRAFEALVRWEHPVHGLVPPGVFIPLAEDSGVIGEIGTWVLRESVRWAAQIHPAVYLSVNLSTRQLEDPSLGGMVSAALAEYGVPAERLTLEITESVLLDGEAEQLARMEALRETGCRISLDDFGTGYSSLSYLQDLPLDVLKLDMSFALRLVDGEDQHASTIIATVSALARGLGLDFVVEGVETAEQLGRLRRLGCQLGQGYLFSRPLPAQEAIAFAAAGVPGRHSIQAQRAA
jgi:diguanylate cyclase (GGDEF)-like protein